jgi:hypothetical protein
MGEREFIFQDWRRITRKLQNPEYFKPDLHTAMDNQRATTAGIIGNDILLHILDKIEDLTDYTYLATAEGIYDQVTVPVTPQITELNHLNPLTSTMPWKATTIYNAGKFEIYMGVNQSYITHPTPIVCGQTVRVEMGRNQIEKIILTTAPTSSAFNLTHYGSSVAHFFSVK